MKSLNWSSVRCESSEVLSRSQAGYRSSWSGVSVMSVYTCTSGTTSTLVTIVDWTIQFAKQTFHQQPCRRCHSGNMNRYALQSWTHVILNLTMKRVKLYAIQAIVFINHNIWRFMWFIAQKGTEWWITFFDGVINNFATILMLSRFIKYYVSIKVNIKYISDSTKMPLDISLALSLWTSMYSG